MNPEKVVRVLAGTMVLISVALAHFVNEWWLLLAVFAGVNLIQSVFTGFCPPTIIMRKMGWAKEDQSCCK
jgi:predicted PurR-regulated permease PerM